MCLLTVGGGSRRLELIPYSCLQDDFIQDSLRLFLVRWALRICQVIRGATRRPPPAARKSTNGWAFADSVQII